MDRPILVGDSKVERTTIVQAQGQFLALPIKFNDVQVIEGGDAAFNLDVRWNRLAYLVGEVVIDGQMVVNSPEVTIPVEHVAFGCWLFYQTLHECGFTRDPSYFPARSPLAYSRDGPSSPYSSLAPALNTAEHAGADALELNPV
jgi:hypothetical protein